LRHSTLLSLFFYCYADHRDLHSFPTRRSSDLFGLNAAPLTNRGATRSARPPAPPPPPEPGSKAKRPTFPIPGSVNHSAPSGRLRSEEHTSELQSRGHLVCRLLLEKKKRATPTA